MGQAVRGARDAGFAIAFAAIPCGLFLLFFHPEILDPTRIGWLMQGDWGAHWVGWNAFRHDVWRFPLGWTRLVAWPNGASLTFTDSIPLVSLALKPFAAVLPEPFQFTGWWFLACLVLQFGLAFALVRRSTGSRCMALGAATVLMALPTLYNRIGHASLFGHWTILLSLWLFLEVEDEGRRDLAWVLALVIAALVHPYLLLMSAAIWASDVMRRGVRAAAARDVRGLGGLAASSILVGLAPVAALWLVGGLKNDTGEVGGFGGFSMALDALVNPGRREFARLLPAAPQGPEQVFEGFQYLGAGIIGLIAVAAGALALRRASRERVRVMAPMLWLAPAMLVLTALALSDPIQLHGRAVAHVSYGWIPFGLTDVFRSSGRLFWPCAYLLVLVALRVVLDLPRPWPVFVCAGVLAVQAYDVSGLIAATRAQTAAAVSPAAYVRTENPAWERLIGAASLVEFEPPDPHADERLFYEIATRATSRRKPVDVMYTARPSWRQTAFEKNARARFDHGERDPQRLYVLGDSCALPVEADARLVDGVPVVPPAGTGGRQPRAALVAAALDETISMAAGSPIGRCLLGPGWAQPEPWGVWSNEGEAELLIPLAAAGTGKLKLTLVAHGFPFTGQDVAVSVAGRSLGTMRLVGKNESKAFTVSGADMVGGVLRVGLRIGRPQSPSSLKLGSDARTLGIGLETVRLDPAGP